MQPWEKEHICSLFLFFRYFCPLPRRTPLFSFLFLCLLLDSITSLSSRLLPSRSLYFQVSWLSCRRNELNLSPTVQTTADRVRTGGKINRSPPVPFGDWTRVCARELLMRLRGQMRNKPVPKRHSGSFINMSSSQRL